jgi:membrane-bound lytic murein transglycosylase B
LAVITQESNLGKNIGQCYLRNTTTGSGVNSSGKTIANIMKPTRDVTPFLTITKELGRDPYNTPVSCPMSFGYGGAMGPAQFIPSTWMLYRDRIQTLTGEPGDPWDIYDAFLASALYLADSGAKAQTYNAEWKAAMIYFSGSTSTEIP